jgi:hypothetical protein
MAKHYRIFSRLWLLLLLTVFLGVASTAASAAAKSSLADATSTTLQPQQVFRRTVTKPSSLEHHQLDNTLPAMQQNKERKLPGYDDVDISESIHRLFSTAPEAWTAGQWILALVIILLTLWCCGCCLAGGRQQYRGGGYNYYSRQSNGGMCGCLQNVLACVCCYEWCCRDCQDVPCCNNEAGGEYYRQTGDLV